MTFAFTCVARWPYFWRRLCALRFQIFSYAWTWVTEFYWSPRAVLAFTRHRRHTLKKAFIVGILARTIFPLLFTCSPVSRYPSAGASSAPGEPSPPVSLFLYVAFCRALRLFRTWSHHETIISRPTEERLMEQSQLWLMLYAIGKQLLAFHRLGVHTSHARNYLAYTNRPIYSTPWNLLYYLLLGV